LIALKNSGWTVKIFPYDWRKRVSDNAKLLKIFLDSQVKSGEKVDVVAHSMGGLLARSYIEQEGNNNKIDKLITVGTPHKGSVEAYPIWSAGQLPSGDPLERFYLLSIEKLCALKTLNDRDAIQLFFPSIQDLLPTFDYLIDNKTNQTKSFQTMTAKNWWLLDSQFSAPYSDITIGTLSGNNQETESAFRVDPPNQQDQLLGNWQDGKPVKTITTQSGDGTVLTLSSSLPNADDRTIDGDHRGIISSQEGIDQIINFLNGPKMLQATTPKINKQEQPSPTSGLFIVGYPATVWVIDPHGKILKDSDGLISILDPKSGLYELIFWPSEKDTHIIVAQMLSENRNYWKAYTFKNFFPKLHLPQIHFIMFDDKHPKGDILN